jgi:hypothetical protein
MKRKCLTCDRPAEHGAVGRPVCRAATPVTVLPPTPTEDPESLRAEAETARIIRKAESRQALSERARQRYWEKRGQRHGPMSVNHT